MLRYGRTLLQNRPAETTDVLIDLCSGNFLIKQKALVARLAQKKHPEQESESQTQQTSVNYLSYLGYDKMTGVFSSSNAANGKTTESTPGADTKPVDDSIISKEQPETAIQSTTYTIPSPRQYFAHFISSPGQFMRFLESLAADRWNQTVSGTSTTTTDTSPRKVEKPIEHGSPIIDLDPEVADQRCIWNTLLELYLTDAQDTTSASSTSCRRKALNVIDRTGDLPVDPMHALMVCSTAGFTSGQIKLWEKLGMYEEVLRYCMNVPADDIPPNATEPQRSASENVLHYLHLYGPANPPLYPLVLRYLSSDAQLVSKHATDVRDILSVIDEENLMPPLAVVQLLSRNSVTTIGVVKDWLRAKVADTRHDVESVSPRGIPWDFADVGLLFRIKCLSSHTAQRRKRSSKRSQIWPMSNIHKCSKSRDAHPVVGSWIFLRFIICANIATTSGASTWQNAINLLTGSPLNSCLPDADPECPSCSRQFAVISQIRRHQQELAGRHDLFLSEVSEADDGFGVIAGAFGRGLLNKPVLT